mgnify:CR=1 FL=1
MSIILGLNCYHADSSACIFVNNKLEFGIEEERINRKKHWAGLPINSIKACLSFTGLKISDVTDITINTDPFSNIGKKASYFLKNYLSGSKKKEIFKRVRNKFNLLDDINKNFKKDNLHPNIKLHYIDHHKSHIASAFYPSNFNKAVGLSVDGFGDFCSVAVAKCENQEIKIIDRIYFPHSLGVFYEAFTQLLGFSNYGDEYKVMGLSSYGSPKYFEEILNDFFLNNKSINLNLSHFSHTEKNFKYKFKGFPNQSKLFKKSVFSKYNISKNQKISIKQKDIASSVQKVFEHKLLEIINKIKDLKFSSDLVYAGGCALNSLANKKILDKKIFKKIFIPYAPGDGGGSIGSALVVVNKKFKKIKIKNLHTPYIGPYYSDDEILNYAKNHKQLNNFNFKVYRNKKKLLNEIAKLIYKNKIIGYLNGRMEFGARALGNRSIIANPCNPNIKDIINIKIKRRENFRPFAPTIISEKKKIWFQNERLNPYMSVVESIKPIKRKYIPAVTHIDGTGRVQTISKKYNSDFYTIIKNFEKLSGVPIILNTSFNENEPIVMNYKDAINCFLRTKMDVIVLNNLIIRR